METEPKKFIKIDILPGTELNFGGHEDGDSVITVKKTRALVIGETEGSKLIRIIEHGEPSKQVFHFHQPEKPKK